ncbi:MAG: hypothetical protein Q8P67_06215 [archaeon]|nr:hypothetical protein [archaeon]
MVNWFSTVSHVLKKRGEGVKNDREEKKLPLKCFFQKQTFWAFFFGDFCFCKINFAHRSGRSKPNNLVIAARWCGQGMREDAAQPIDSDLANALGAACISYGQNLLTMPR